MFQRYLKSQLTVLLCGGLVGPIFLIVYFTLGHCRGRFDVADLGIADLGVVDRVAWQSREYREILRRCVAWATHGPGWEDCLHKESA